MEAGELGQLEMRWARALLDSRKRVRVGVHLGCSTLKNQHRRRWPVQQFARLMRKLTEEDGAECLAFAGPDERPLLPVVEAQAPEALCITDQSIDRVAALIRCCDVFVASDSSLGHLAAACGVPVVSIFGPTNPAYTAPWGVPHRLVRQPGLSCSPCYQVSRHPLTCPAGRDFSCVRQIEVEAVRRACISLIHETQTKGGRDRGAGSDAGRDAGASRRSVRTQRGVEIALHG